MEHGRDREVYLFLEDVRLLAKRRGFSVQAYDKGASTTVWTDEKGGDLLSIDFIPQERPKHWKWNGKSTPCGVCADGPCASFPGMMHDSVCLEGTLKMAEDPNAYRVKIVENHSMWPPDPNRKYDDLKKAVDRIRDVLIELHPELRDRLGRK